ncbi:PLDc N-terminal domain-containing protein [Actinocorallia longicatena]|uniref:PLDc N-terminal domain-containing protein n=1 Tax=Actinocorallia longicatena TaxID=111803 RepID=A0ABP6PXW7_9ACTN
MLVLFEGFGLLLLGLWIFALFDVITTPEIDCRNLPKTAWILIVLFLPDIGSIIWLVAGRPTAWQRQPNLPYKGNSGRFPEYDRPGRAVANNPDDDATFLQGLRDRAEEQRRKAREQPGDQGV